MISIWKLFGHKPEWSPSKGAPLAVRLEEILKGYDRHVLRSELEAFKGTKVWEALRAFILEEKMTHETLMHSAIGHSNLHCEASYEAGCYKSLTYASDYMMPYFLEYLTTGKQPGVVDSPPPEDEEEDAA